MKTLLSRLLGILAMASGFIAALLVLGSGLGYRAEALDLGQAFTLLRWGAYLGLASLPLILGYSFWRKPGGAAALGFAASIVLGLISFYLPFSQLQTAKSVPPIHDISTDLDNPPAFVAIAPLRANAPNPAAYAGEDTARQQREAYPDVQPLILEQPMGQVFNAVQASVADLGWEPVAAERQGDSARVEATDTTLWFGFKDDVVIRLQPEGEAIRVDVRSKSRVGKSDVGANAARIKRFFEQLKAELN